MKKIILFSLTVVFLLLILSFSSVMSTQYLINEGESIVFKGKTINLAGVSDSDTVVIDVDGTAKAINQGETKTFDGVRIKVISVYYYPKEGEISSALLEIYEATIRININEGDSTTVNFGGIEYTVGVGGVSDANTAVITVNGVSKAIDQGHTMKINGLYVYLDAVYYYPKEGEISQVKVTLSDTLLLNEGDSTIITFDGTDYTIGVSGISDANTAVITVNEESKAIDQGQSKEIGGLYIYLSDVNYHPKEGQISSATLDVSETITTTTIFTITTYPHSCDDTDGGKDIFKREQ